MVFALSQIFRGVFKVCALVDLYPRFFTGNVGVKVVISFMEIVLTKKGGAENLR